MKAEFVLITEEYNVCVLGRKKRKPEELSSNGLPSKKKKNKNKKNKVKTTAS